MKPINVPHIFHDQSVKACLSIDIKFDNPSVTYSFTNFVSNLNVKTFLQDNTILPCNYVSTGFTKDREWELL